MILIGLGGNLPSRHGSAAETLAAALAALEGEGIRVAARSRWYETAPIPPSDQPWFVNGVAAVATALPPGELLDRLHAVEAAFGRERSVPNAARTIDLDLLDYDGRIVGGWPVLPHPRLHERAFVLRPLVDVAPGWRHPRSGRTAEELLAAIGTAQFIRPIDSKG
jgi:2-amino-4-hydroxy-6-hydroxymethyldihydropteridine diphosphokinase